MSKPKHILVINDTQEILDLFFEILHNEGGYDVTLSSYKPHILLEIKDLMPDLVISDHIFGEEKVGWQMVQRMRMDRDTARIPIIVCSAAVRELRELEGHLTDKNVGILFKPFDVDELLETVGRMLRESEATGENKDGEEIRKKQVHKSNGQNRNS